MNSNDIADKVIQVIIKNDNLLFIDYPELKSGIRQIIVYEIDKGLSRFKLADEILVWITENRNECPECLESPFNSEDPYHKLDCKILRWLKLKEGK